jgi:ribonuclease HII
VAKLAKSPSKHHKSDETQLRIEGVSLDGLDLREFDRIVTTHFGELCGIDEAGRGPGAGSVYAAAVILDENNPIDGLNDSKKLTPKKREMLYDEIIAKAKAYGIAFSTVEQIESTDILSATLDAMKRAYESLGVTAGLVLVDGDVLPEIDGTVRNMNKGDAKSEAIAAASILAKVSRDRYMTEQAALYPEYGFEKHKGYVTAAHIDAVEKYGFCRIHRKSYFTKVLAKRAEKNGQTK